MKKNLLYLFTVLCTLSLFTACGDDDNDKKTVDYSGSYTGESLAVSMGDVVLPVKAVSIANNTMTLPGMIPGEADLAIPCTFIDNAFSGTSKTDGREVTVEGSIIDKKATVKVKVKMTNSLVGGTFSTSAQSLSLAYETPKDKITFMGDPTYDPKGLPVLIGMMGGSMLTQYLQDVTFNEDGTIVATYLKDKTPTVSPKGYAFYNVKDGKIFVSVNIGMMMGKADANPLDGIMQMLQNGLPLGLVVDGNKASFIVTRDMMMPFMPMLPLLAGMLNNELITLLATEIPTIVTESTKFDLSLNLTKK